MCRPGWTAPYRPSGRLSARRKGVGRRGPKAPRCAASRPSGRAGTGGRRVLRRRPPSTRSPHRGGEAAGRRPGGGRGSGRREPTARFQGRAGARRDRGAPGDGRAVPGSSRGGPDGQAGMAEAPEREPAGTTGAPRCPPGLAHPSAPWRSEHRGPGAAAPSRRSAHRWREAAERWRHRRRRAAGVYDRRHRSTSGPRRGPPSPGTGAPWGSRRPAGRGQSSPRPVPAPPGPSTSHPPGRTARGRSPAGAPSRSPSSGVRSSEESAGPAFRPGAGPPWCGHRREPARPAVRREVTPGRTGRQLQQLMSADRTAGGPAARRRRIAAPPPAAWQPVKGRADGAGKRLVGPDGCGQACWAGGPAPRRAVPAPGRGG